jgi:hypothetical protein
MAITAKKKTETLEVPRLVRKSITVYLKGTTPLIINRVSQKAKRELMLPGKKTAATRAANLKHNPAQEFRDAAYTLPSGPTLLAMPAVAFKAAMRSAALRIEGASKQQIGEMLFVAPDYADLVSIWGKPHLFTAITRNSDVNHTPDVRTRCIVTDWAAKLEIIYATPYLNETSVINLLGMAGMTQGIGDGRPNKGWGNFGCFDVVGGQDVEELMGNWDRAAQVDMRDNPLPYDAETAELVGWFDDELERRGIKAPATQEE